MKHLLTLMFCLIFLFASAQEQSKLMKQGQDYFSKKQYEKALQNFDKEFKKNPSVYVKFWIAHTHTELKNVEIAKPLFLEIIKSDHQGPEIAMSLINLGNCYRALEQTDSAHFCYDRAISEFPKMASGYFNKGQLLYSESKFEQAKQNYDKAIEIKQDDWYYYQKRLEVCFASQQYECALQDLIKVKQLKPDAKVDFNLAYCYSMLERFDEADSIFQMIYDEKDPLFLNNYGLNKHNLGKTEEAKKLILKSLEINPKNAYAHRNLAVIEIDSDNVKKACEHLYKAQSLGFEKRYGNEVNELLSKHCH